RIVRSARQAGRRPGAVRLPGENNVVRVPLIGKRRLAIQIDLERSCSETVQPGRFVHRRIRRLAEDYRGTERLVIDLEVVNPHVFVQSTSSTIDTNSRVAHAPWERRWELVIDGHTINDDRDISVRL